MKKAVLALAIVTPMLFARSAAAEDVDLWGRPVPKQAANDDRLWAPRSVPAPKPKPLRARDASGFGTFGVGVVIGTPTGLTGKYHLNRTGSIDGALAFGSGLYAHSDYLFEGQPLFRPTKVRLTWCAGAGGRLLYDRNGGAVSSGGVTINAAGNGHGHGGGGTTTTSSTSGTSGTLGVGARIPVGLEARFRQIPRLEVYGDAALDVGLLGGNGTAIDAAIGGRWYF